MRNIILVHGKPGLGKSTLAKSVAEALKSDGIKAEHFSIGERLRAISSGEMVSQFSERLAAQQTVLFRHAHVTDPTVIHGVVGEYLRSTTASVVIIDGHPRYMETALGYEQAVSSEGWATRCVFAIDGSDTLARERMAKRDRSDHGFTEDVEWRLSDYRETMTPVMQWLVEHYETVHVDATLPLEEKTATTCNHILSLL